MNRSLNTGFLVWNYLILTDDIFWVFIARDGQKKSYNYVGGPNYEEEWPPSSSGKKSFIIQVLSCDIPYPGITVDVMDPTGKYTVAKSDAKGQVRICGPAGTYSIYASDGWSAQSKTWEWNGKGRKQVKNVVLGLLKDVRNCFYDAAVTTSSSAKTHSASIAKESVLSARFHQGEGHFLHRVKGGTHNC